MADVRIGILGSGKGSNCRAILERIRDGTLAADPRIVIADVADSSLAVSSRSTYQQAPTLGLTEMRWVRIANAVIFTYDTGEAMSDDPGPGREATQRAVQMVTIWCETNGGC